jgi:hypothetical protein
MYFRTSICPNPADSHVLFLATEWIENPEGQFDKQYCERKTFLHLGEKPEKESFRFAAGVAWDVLFVFRK